MWVALLLIALVSCFAVVLLFGAPYLPTLKPQIKAALELVELKPGDTLLELGSGDGRVVLEAAKQGISVIGYELNPLLVVISRLRTWRYRKQVRIIWGNFWGSELPKSEAIFTFLLPKYMEKLNKKVEQSNTKPVKLVSFAFEIPSKKPAKIVNGVYLYLYT